MKTENKTRITYQTAFCNNYNVFVDILPLHLRFVKDITIENWERLLKFFVSKIYYISCQREIKHATFCLCQCYLKIPNLQPRIYGKEWNRDIWKGNYSITINTEETGKIWHMRDKYQYWSSWQNFYWELAAWVLWSAYLAHIPHFLLSQLSFIVPMNSSVESES